MPKAPPLRDDSPFFTPTTLLYALAPTPTLYPRPHSDYMFKVPTPRAYSSFLSLCPRLYIHRIFLSFFPTILSFYQSSTSHISSNSSLYIHLAEPERSKMLR